MTNNPQSIATGSGAVRPRNSGEPSTDNGPLSAGLPGSSQGPLDPGPETKPDRPLQAKGPRSDAERAAMISGILSGETSPPAGADPGGPPDDQTPPDPNSDDAPPRPKPKTLQDAAESLGLSVDELYGLDVGLGGEGGTVTIGGLKDAYARQADDAREIANKALDLQGREIAHQQKMRLWDQLGDRLQQVVPPQLWQQIQTSERNRMADEERKFFQKAPELQDETKLRAFREGMVEILGQFDFSPAEVAVYDHRHLMFLRWAMEQDKILKRYRALEGKPATPKAAPPQGRGMTQPKPAQGSVKHAGNAQAVSAISSLLNKGRHTRG